MKKRNKMFALVLVLALSMSLTIPAFATGGFENPPFDIEWDCDKAYFTGELAEGETGNVQAELWTNDPYTPEGGTLLWNTLEQLTQQGSFEKSVPWGVDPNGNYFRLAIVVEGTTVAVWEGFHDCPPPPGGDYCSPGYFKKHLDAWGPTGYSPDDDFDTVFTVDYFDPNITLLDAVNAKGGGDNALARVGTASLLSAAHPGVDYPLTKAEVILAVQTGDKAKLDQYIDFDCPID